MSAPINILLSRLSSVKKTGIDKYIARCPAHDDHHPSLSIAVGKSGAPVLHCHAGCGAAEVLSVLGLDFADLYPRRPARQGERGPHRYFYPTDVYETIKDRLQLAFLYMKDGNQDGVLSVLEHLHALDFAYNFEAKGVHHE